MCWTVPPGRESLQFIKYRRKERAGHCWTAYLLSLQPEGVNGLKVYLNE